MSFLGNGQFSAADRGAPTDLVGRLEEAADTYEGQHQWVVNLLREAAREVRRLRAKTNK